MRFRIHLFGAILVTTLQLLLILRANAVEYTRKYDLPPLRVTYDDVDAILSKTWGLVETANSQDTNADIHAGSIKLSTPDGEMEIGGHSIIDRTHVPEVAYDFEYMAIGESGPITLIRIDCSDRYRNITVSGHSADQVDTVASALERGFADHTAFAGGLRFRFLLASLTSLAGYFVMVLLSRKIFGKDALENGSIMGTCGVVAVVIQLSFLFLPTDRWFPGFAAFKSEASWLVRCGPQISFFGVVVTIVAIPLGVLLSRWFGQPVSTEPPIVPKRRRPEKTRSGGV